MMSTADVSGCDLLMRSTSGPQLAPKVQGSCAAVGAQGLGRFLTAYAGYSGSARMQLVG